MSDFTTSIYATAFALCLFSAGILSGQRTRAGRPFGFFSAYLFVEAVGFVLEVLMLHPATPLKAVWLALRMIASLLVAPCLWLAMREIVEGERPRLRALSGWHYGVIGVGAALTLPLLGTAHWGSTYSNPARPPVGGPNLVHSTMLLCLAIFAVQVPYYLWRCRRLLLGQVRDLENSGALARAEAGWLHLPLIVVLCSWGVGVVRVAIAAVGATRPEHLVLFAVTQVSVTVVATFLIVRRASAFGPEATTTSFEPPRPVLPAEGKPAPQSYARNSLDAATRERIRRKIEKAMEADAVYSDSLLSLRSLSSAIKEKSHYVSQVINQDLGTTFYELVSRYRIERAKKLLVEQTKQTVLEIALAVGFNSKSTFNAAFRRLTGMTPSEFRASHLPPAGPSSA